MSDARRVNQQGNLLQLPRNPQSMSTSARKACKTARNYQCNVHFGQYNGLRCQPRWKACKFSRWFRSSGFQTHFQEAFIVLGPRLRGRFGNLWIWCMRWWAHVLRKGTAGLTKRVIHTDAPLKVTDLPRSLCCSQLHHS